MKGVNFSFSGETAYDDVMKLVENIYMEEDSWDFEVVITKDKYIWNVWIGDKDV